MLGATGSPGQEAAQTALAARFRPMTVTFGVHTGLQSTTTAELVDLWRRIEDRGFDWISIWDHFYSADAEHYDCLEAVACHTALALTTSRVRCGSLVYCAGYRHPAVLANAMATIDHLSGGRVDVGLGAGWSELEYRAYGIPFPSVASAWTCWRRQSRACAGCCTTTAPRSKAGTS